MARHFRVKEWVALLSDIFSLINELNLKLQDKNNTEFNFYNKIEAFKKKLKFWYEHAQENRFEMFTFLFDYINAVILEDFHALSLALDQYYIAENVRTGNLWITIPFIDNDNHNLPGNRTY